MSLAFPSEWSPFGPFTFQTSRIFHHLIYFLIAVALGAQSGSQPRKQGLVAPDGKLRRRWLLWSIAALVAFLLVSIVGIAAVTSHLGSKLWEAFAGLAFALSCAASCFALRALFLRFANQPARQLLRYLPHPLCLR